MEKNNQKIIRAWCLYDWANSVYSLVITSAIFPVYYQAVAKGANGSDNLSFLWWDSVPNSALYSYALSFSFLVITPLLPLFSGIADYTGKKKKFMRAFCWLGGLACIGMFFFDKTNLGWGIVCIVFASIGYSGSLVFYDAFLPEIATEDQFDNISAKGYSWGYYGGVILLVLCLALIQFHNSFGVEEGIMVRLSFLLVGVWWIGFAHITFARLPEEVRKTKATLLQGYEELRKVWKSFSHNPDLKKYVLAYFFFNMGVQTVMYMAATFGAKELKLPDTKLILTVLIIQLVAALGAHVFARLSGHWGNKRILLLMIVFWVFICLGAYTVQTEYQFYTLAFTVGIVMGGIQSLSRATYSKLIPQNSIDTASYFSFFDVTFNLSIVVGTFSYGFIEHLTGSMRNSTLAIATFFVVGLLLLTQVRAQSIAVSYFKKTPR
jgi:UMF1 family MFS transporter